MGQTHSTILDSFDPLLSNPELKEVPRAVILLRLCGASLLFAPERAEGYWGQLSKLQHKVPPDLQSLLGGVRETMEAHAGKEVKGFAGEILGDAEAATGLHLAGTPGARDLLRDCESRINKRKWPTGKARSWAAVVSAWAGIDRKEALRLCGHLSGEARDNLVKRLNTAATLTPEEWEILAEGAGTKAAVGLALAVLEEDPPEYFLPKDLAEKVGSKLVGKLEAILAGADESDLSTAFTPFVKLILFQAKGGCEEVASDLLTTLWKLLTTTQHLDKKWPERFGLLGTVLETCSSTEEIEHSTVARLLDRTPEYLTPFAKAHYAGARVTDENTFELHRELLVQTRSNSSAEAWFFVSLVRKGMGEAALALARSSKNAQNLIPRIRRAWLINDPDTAAAAISPEDMSGDPIGQFLALGSEGNQVAFLKAATVEGGGSVPGAMWVDVVEEDEDGEPKGFWASLTASEKPFEEQIQEYLTQNPLYSSYKPDEGQASQFSEYVRIEGYGEYAHAHVDRALVRAMVAWGDQEPEAVRSILKSMWIAIQPDENVLMVNFLRNAVLERCRRVLVADPDVFIRDHMRWLKRELVEKGRTWAVGGGQISLKFPPGAPLAFCVSSAAEVGALSPTRRDQIIVQGLTEFAEEASSVENAALVYASASEKFELTPPVELNRQLVEAWQTGVAKAAVNQVFQLLASAGQQDQEG